MKKALLKSVNLLGDSLYVGPVAKRWYDTEGKNFDEVHLLTIQNHAVKVYEGMGVPWKIIYESEGPYDRELDFDVGKAFQISDKKKCHLVKAYAELVDVSPDGLISKPNYQPPEMEVSEDKKGLVMVSMWSMSCASRENPPKPPNKMLPWFKWKPLLDTLREEYGSANLRLLGAAEDLVPLEDAISLGILWPRDYLLGIPIPELANIMKYARCIVTVDNGMGHLAAAMGLNEFLIVPAVLAMHFIVPWGHKGLRTVHVDPVTCNPGSLDWQLKSAIKDWKEIEGERGEQQIA